MTVFQITQHWLFWPVIAIYTAVCIVWAALVVGAWVASLENPPLWLKWAALKAAIADQVMKPIVRELVTLITTVGLLAVAYLQGLSVESNYSRTAATYLAYARGSGTPRSIVEGISAFSELPGKYQRTLKAYREFFESEGRPNIELIQNKLPPQKDQTAFDVRLMGLSYDLLAENMAEPKAKSLQQDYYKKARDYYNDALQKVQQNPLRDPSDEASTRFTSALRSNLAGIDLSLGKLDDDRKLLEAARDSYTKIRTETGLPGAYLNSAAAHSLLGKYDPAEFTKAQQVLQSVATDPRLKSADRQFIRENVSNLKVMHELVPLADYLKSTKQTEWQQYVDSLFTASAPATK